MRQPQELAYHVDISQTHGSGGAGTQAMWCKTLRNCVQLNLGHSSRKKKHSNDSQPCFTQVAYGTCIVLSYCARHGVARWVGGAVESCLFVCPSGWTVLLHVLSPVSPPRYRGLGASGSPAGTPVLIVQFRFERSGSSKISAMFSEHMDLR